MNTNEITLNPKAEPPHPSESELRRKAARRGYKLCKIRETCRGYNEYGPFMIVDADSNRAVDYRLTLEEAADWLDIRKKADWMAGVL